MVSNILIVCLQGGAESVNLVACEKPADVYSGIANRFVVHSAGNVLMFWNHVALLDHIMISV